MPWLQLQLQFKSQHNEFMTGALGPVYKLESHVKQQSPQLPSLVNTRGYIKQVTIQNILSLFS